MLLLCLTYPKDYVLNTLYDIIVPEYSIMFYYDYMVITVTMSYNL